MSESSKALSEEERAALAEHVAEQRTAAKRKGSTKAEKAAADAQDVVDKIAAMPQPDRGLAERVHAVVTAAGPQLAPRLWYGMPAYALDGKVLCYFQDAAKFKARYATFGFNDPARLDDGAMWPTSFALVEVGPEQEAAIADLVRRAAG